MTLVSSSVLPFHFADYHNVEWYIYISDLTVNT